MIRGYIPKGSIYKKQGDIVEKRADWFGQKTLQINKADHTCL